MARNIKTNRKFESLKCIWMQNGLIQYKLCDKQFDCDQCIFDKVMRNVKLEISDFDSGVTRNIIDQKIKDIQELKYSENIIYLKNNLILKNLFGNTYYMGISPLGYHILDHNPGFNYCKDGIPIQINNPVAQFFGDWGSYKLLSPLNFYSLGRLKQEIENTNMMEWFLLVETYPTEIETAKLSREEYYNQLNNAEIYLKNINSEYKVVGATMNDGGTEVIKLDSALNNAQYIDLLKTLFSQI